MGIESNTQENQEEPIKQEAENTVQEVAKINAIRDIIFGTDMAEYNQQFDALKQLIGDNKSNADNDKEELLDKIQQLEDNVNNSLKSLEDRITTKLDQLQEEKTDRRLLGNLLEDIGKKIKQ